jgi:hypothetical protein
MLSHQMKSGTDIPAPPGATRPIPEWTDLKFNPLGLFNLRRRLGMLTDQPGIFTQYQGNFLLSDISWFAAGLHTDSQHTTPIDQCHSLFLTAQEHVGVGERANKLRFDTRDAVRDGVFDLVSISTPYTFICHSLEL